MLPKLWKLKGKCQRKKLKKFVLDSTTYLYMWSYTLDYYFLERKKTKLPNYEKNKINVEPH